MNREQFLEHAKTWFSGRPGEVQMRRIQKSVNGDTPDVFSVHRRGADNETGPVGLVSFWRSSQSLGGVGQDTHEVKVFFGEGGKVWEASVTTEPGEEPYDKFLATLET